MIMRRWRGVVTAADLEAYLRHQDETGVREYRATPGNLGVFVLTRPLTDDRVEVTTLSLWESMDAVRAFAGADPEAAVFYPGDDDLLVDKDLHVDHFETASVDLSASLLS